MTDAPEEVGTDHRRKVDPAALLVGVFAVGAGPLLQNGQWNYVNTVSALVVLAVVLFFTWPGKNDRPLLRRACFTYALVYGFMTAIASAWLMQQLIEAVFPANGCVDKKFAGSVLEYYKLSDCNADTANTITGWGTFGGMMVGLISAIVWFGTMGGFAARTMIDHADESEDSKL